ncbi:transposase [Hymenobacter humi]|uniref:Transposase n=1 Tax=Hymenobacter humi TaxID=1411620 RepID=A0ABW2U9J1_9BACT
MKDRNGLYGERYRINSVRRAGYDYSKGGGYFITICTKNRIPYFGQIQPATDDLHDAYLNGTNLAEQAWHCWQQIPLHFPFAEPDAFVVMPDHVHGILFIHRSAEYVEQAVAQFGPQSDNLASIIRGFKVGVKAWATRQGLEFAWQSSFYDRIIRNEAELEKIRKYVLDNPNRWESEAGEELGIFR